MAARTSCSARSARVRKAGRVVPHKVWQGLAASPRGDHGRRRGAARAVRAGRDLIAVPRGDATALATGLAELIRDASLRERLGGAGHARASELGTPARLGAALRDVLERVTKRHR
jgi:hypothetical protein